MPRRTVVTWLAQYREILLVSAIACGVFLVSAHQSGIWEPYESNVASVAENMVNDRAWLSVDTRIATDSSDPQETVAISGSALPFEYWPVAVSVSTFGVSEIGLRLPMVLFMSILIGLLMWTVREHAGKAAAWCTVLVALSLPLFIFHGRFAFGHGTAIATSAISALLFMNAARAPCSWLYGLGWLSAAFAGLSGGLLALTIPLVVYGCLWVYGQPPRPSHAQVRIFAPVLAALIVGIGLWRAYVHSGADSLETWLFGLLQLTDLDSESATGKRPFFNLFVHQIGFGLFPFGALLPIVFADLCWNADEKHPWIGPVLLLWCAMGFLGPALGLMHTHYGIFLSAPAAAMALGIYFYRVIKGPSQPALACLSVVLVALLDSNLKHDTQLLADAIVGGKVDSFPAEFPHWEWARRLNMAFLGMLLLYQGGIHRWCKAFIRFFFYPKAAPKLYDGLILMVSVIMPIVLVINFFFPEMPVLRFSFLMWEGNGSHLFVSPKTQMLAILFGLGLWIVTYWILWTLYDVVRCLRTQYPAGTRAFNAWIFLASALPTLYLLPWLRHLVRWAEMPIRRWFSPTQWIAESGTSTTLFLVALSFGLLAYALLWSGLFAVRRINGLIRKQTPIPTSFFSPKIVLASLVFGIASKPHLAVLSGLERPTFGLGSMKAFLGQIIVATLAWVVIYWILWLAVTLRAHWLKGRQEGRISGVYDFLADLVDGQLRQPDRDTYEKLPRRLRGITVFMNRLYGWLSRVGSKDGESNELGSEKTISLPIPLFVMMVCLSTWMVFMNGPVAAAMTDNMSSKAIVDRYRALSQDGEQLYTFGKINRSIYFDKLTALKSDEFKSLIGQEERFFAVVPRKGLANANLIYAEEKTKGRSGASMENVSPEDTAIPVLYDGGSRYYLVSNQLRDGEENLSPIRKALPDSIPEKAKEIQVNFDDKIELVGWWVEPEFPKPGSPMTTHLIFRSLVDNPGNWKIFMHIDPVGHKQRIHGDHEPVQGVHPTKNWRKGQLIHDQYEIEISRTHPIGDYKFNLGLYRGKPRMKINGKKTKQKHKENRVEIGTIRLK